MPKAFLCPYFHHIRPASGSNPERVTCDGGVTRFKDAQISTERPARKYVSDVIFKEYQTIY